MACAARQWIYSVLSRYATELQGNEEAAIAPYLEKHPNIVYIKLEKDPGLYAVWNIGVKMAKAPLITNANLDDRRNPLFLEEEVKFLEEHKDIDLVYAEFYYNFSPNANFEDSGHTLARAPEFTPAILKDYMQGPHPVWRKSMHERSGYFSEIFSSAGDWEMWCRAVDCGSKFKKLPGVSGVWFWNPEGISTNKNIQRAELREAESQFIKKKYRHLWEPAA